MHDVAGFPLAMARFFLAVEGADEMAGLRIQKTIRVSATPSELYEFWTNPENYPKVFAHVNPVTRERNGLFRWQFNLQFEEKANAPEAGNGEVSNKEVLNKKEVESRL